MKNILIVNPTLFFNFILSENIIFNDTSKLSTINNLDLKNKQNFATFLNSFEQVFIDDFYDNDLLLDQNLQQFKIRSLVEFYENTTKHAAIIFYKNEYHTPNYLEKLKPNIFFNLLFRVLDILFCFLILPLVLFILTISIIILFIFSGTPIFFKQKRIGRFQYPFTLFKLRTMINNHNMSHTVVNDNRIFPLGLFFRKYKIDELPQILNIFKGNMSFFGPRPERVEIYHDICNSIPAFNKRLLVRPGLTGWAQIYNPIATPNESFEKLQYDIYFIKNISFKMIFIIIYKTIEILIKKNSL